MALVAHDNTEVDLLECAEHNRDLQDTGDPFSSGGLIPTSKSNGGGNAKRLPTLGEISSPASTRVKSRTTNTREEAGDLILPDGVAVPVRTIRPDDAPALQRLYGRLSNQSIHLRFFSYMKQLPDHMAKHLACVDGINRFALVALDPDDPDEIIAVVRYDRQPPGDERAEYAALVEDRWQGLGIGTALTRRLIEAARDKGVRFFYALVMGENKRMLNVLRHLDLPEQERREDGAKRVEVRLFSEETQRPG